MGVWGNARSEATFVLPVNSLDKISRWKCNVCDFVLECHEVEVAIAAIRDKIKPQVI